MDTIDLLAHPLVNCLLQLKTIALLSLHARQVSQTDQYLCLLISLVPQNTVALCCSAHPATPTKCRSLFETLLWIYCKHGSVKISPLKNIVLKFTLKFLPSL